MTFSPTSNALSAPTNESPSYSLGFADRHPKETSPWFWSTAAGWLVRQCWAYRSSFMREAVVCATKSGKLTAAEATSPRAAQRVVDPVASHS